MPRSRGTRRRQLNRAALEAKNMTSQPDATKKPSQGEPANDHRKHDGTSGYGQRLKNVPKRMFSALIEASGNANFWLVLGTWALAFVAYWTLSSANTASEKQLNILRNQTRAFVYFDRIEFQVGNITPSDKVTGPIAVYNLPGNLGRGVAVSVVFTNGGTTQTKDARVRVACFRPRDLGGNFIPESNTPPTSTYNSDTPDEPTVLGPKQSKTFGPCAQITQSDLVDIGSGAFRFIVAAEIDYRDVADPKTLHKTFAEQRITIINANLDHFAARFADTGKLNCADEECPENATPEDAAPTDL